MEEKKKSNIGIILLVIVLLCAAFAGGYFVNEKGLIGGEKEAPKEEEKETKKEMDKKDARRLLNRFAITANTVSNYNDNVKFTAATDSIPETGLEWYDCDKLLADELSEWEKIKIPDSAIDYSRRVGENYYYCVGNDIHELLSFDDVNDTFKEMFDKEIEKKNYSGWYYVKKYDGFSNIPYGDGTTGPTAVIDEIKSVTVNNDKVVITTAMELIFAEDDHNFKVGDHMLKYDSQKPETVDAVEKEIVEKYLDEVKAYEIKFKIKDNRYIFDSIKKI